MSKSDNPDSYMVFVLCDDTCKWGCTKHGYRWGSGSKKSGEKPYWQDTPPGWVK